MQDSVFSQHTINKIQSLAFTEEFKYNENDMEDEYESQDVGGSGKVLEKKKSKNWRLIFVNRFALLLETSLFTLSRRSLSLTVP